MITTYRDHDGQPTTEPRWRALMHAGTQIARTALPNGLTVSTVYVGHDPVYQSRVFGDPARDIASADYGSQAEALVGHATLVVRWQDA